jgi:hypothetical protein
VVKDHPNIPALDIMKEVGENMAKHHERRAGLFQRKVKKRHGEILERA